MSTKEQAGTYTPSQNNRFEVSADPYSQARYKAICEAPSFLKERFPHFAGFTLFGSLSKGKVLTSENALVTDVDLNLFIDIDILGLRIRKPNFFQPDPSLQKSEQTLSLAGQLIKDEAAKVINLLHPADLPLGEVDLYPRPISKVNGNKGSLGYLLEYLGDVNSMLDEFSPGASGVVAAPFARDIGVGLREYHIAWFEQLLQLDRYKAESNWKVTTRCMRLWERNEDVPLNLQRFYPETLEQAIEYYCRQVFSVEGLAF